MARHGAGSRGKKTKLTSFIKKRATQPMVKGKKGILRTSGTIGGR